MYLPGASRCSRRRAVINYGQLDRFITFSARREALYRVTLYEASGSDEDRRCETRNYAFHSLPCARRYPSNRVYLLSRF